ncbi:MAG: PD40 domain-containing protein [Sedimentisphaerales bacterium]|nr:PD40 domain-containing protein [Sedimentisphaerales bacterium]
MSKYRNLTLVLALALAAVSLCVLLYGCRERIESFDTVDRLPRIRPDYSGIVLPPNIAPLNFAVEEDGLHYCAKIYSKNGGVIEVFSRSGKIAIPQEAWHRLLGNNRGQQLYFDVYVKGQSGRWSRYACVTSKIADEDIDSFLVYRKMNYTTIHFKGPMAVYQRDLRSFEEMLILNNSSYKGGCLNCHSFCRNHPDKMLIGIRSFKGYGISTLFIEDGKVEKIRAKFGYTSWHPSGKLAVYSMNNLPMFWHLGRTEVRDTVNLDSSLAYFLPETSQLKTSPEISQKEQLENWPVWSADGKFLYFCRALKPASDTKTTAGEKYKDIRYDLVRISYDVNSDQWGQAEEVLLAKDAGRSIAMPSISPDGRWLSFCMIDYGYFPCWQSDSDLYLMDLEAAEQTGKFEYRRLDISSSESESWQSWSSNSRWLVFSSKRDYGVFTRTYISYVDREGKVYKPILLPQKDPALYDSCLSTYTVPEMIIEPVKVAGDKLGRVIRGSSEVEVDMPITMATPKADLSEDF